MPPSNLLRALCLALAAAGPAAAQATQPEGGDARSPETDRQYQGLEADFGHLYRSLTGGGGIAQEDRPTLEAFRKRVDDFGQEHPDHAGAVAMSLQLSLWLEDQPRARAQYERLMTLRPEDREIAHAWLDFLQRSGDEEPALLAAYNRLWQRFPDDAGFGLGLVARLKRNQRYGEAIGILRAGDLDLDASPELRYDLADCLFAEHQFDEALATLEQIAQAGLSSRVRSEIDRTRPFFTEYVDLWPREQAIRAAETEADDLPRVELITVRGRILLELFENEAPNTVANFIALVESGFYAGTTFHRYEPDFMIQGGDPNSRSGATGTPGTGNPGYRIPDEHAREDYRRHFRDSIAMAKTAAPDTAGCQFYLTHRPTAWLNGKHTVFGRVLDGLDIVRALRKDDQILAANVVRKRDHEYTPTTLPLK